MENTISYQAYLKSPFKSIKHTTYFEVYDALLSRYIGKNITFVEIGILGGGSLFMWRDFLGPQARIIGVDLNPSAKKWEKDGFEIFIGSQSDEVFWQNFCSKVGKLDVVLDDGGHTYLQQVTTCEMLLPYINQNGMLIVEDTHTSYMNGFGQRNYSFINYTNIMIDNINRRSGKLGSELLDNRVWSVQTFDSIVAFHVNHNATVVTSVSTTNNGMDDLAEDFRHHENELLSFYRASVKHLNFLKYIYGLKRIASLIREFIGNHTGQINQLKKYFKSNISVKRKI